MPVDREIKSELESFRSDVHQEVKEMNAAAIRHVEKIVAPFTDVPQRLGVVEGETKKQTPILEELAEEAKRAKKARIAAKAERLRRAGADEDKKKREEEWNRLRKRIAGGLALFVAAAEIYHYLFVK